MTIKKAAVIGAGVMGAGIAAHLANAGLEVELLDIVLQDNPDRDVIATGAIARMAKTKPAPLMHKSFAKRIRAGNTEDHLDRLKDCDLIIEAVKEDPAIKSAIFKKIDSVRKAGAVVASNTSTIPLSDLVSDQSEDFTKHFMITHFFNPPRYMPLLELVTSDKNDPVKVKEIEAFMDVQMGKGVVHCHDTPGFIANRIGTFWIQSAINAAHDLQLTVEEADAISGRPMGVPKTGIFGLVDLVGLDLMPHISKSLLSKLPESDEYAKIHRSYPVIEKMIADGYTGRKGKGGFYRLNAKREKLAVDLETGAERPSKKVKMKAAVNAKKGGLKALVETQDKGGSYAWEILKRTLSYVAAHAEEIAPDIAAVDQAMRLGYNWKSGPFEMMDKLGAGYLAARLKTEGLAVPKLIEVAAAKDGFYKKAGGTLQQLGFDGAYHDIKRPDGVLLLSDIKRASKPVAKNMSASLWDIGDGVLCLEFHSKMNALNVFSMWMIHKACNLIEKGGTFKALVIHNEAEQFSVGANIGVALYAAKAGLGFLVGPLVSQGQDTYKRLKYAPFPVVSAPSGVALGGGCEILLHSTHVQAHAETYTGLVEVGVGLLPAWGGCAELLTRAKQNPKMAGGPIPAVRAVFETISTAKVATSAYEAKELMYFRESDGVTMNKQRLLADAKAKALELIATHKPEAPFEMELPGPAGLAAFNNAVEGFYLGGAATSYDVIVSDRVARVLTGDDKAGPGVIVTQDDIRALEKKYFMALFKDKRTIARIATMLSTNKPLREKPQAGVTAADLRASANPAGESNDNIGTKVDTRARMNWPQV